MVKKKIPPALPKNKGKTGQLSTGQTFINGKLLNKEEIHDIIMLANSLANNHLLIDLIEEVENEAAKRIYYKSNTLEQLSFGKGMLESLDLLKRKIINITNIKT